ncbi:MULTISPECIES: tripartite tricarboxylate transporter substrate binding protein [Halomonas]|uniref:Tripartite tricarboxylate transporter substrate binding protein n=1 Tax=Halomonas casei TaxID=2742613 RepID=A0ABR9EZI3_9GAMM|nr:MULTISPECIES: tripartite tricarboxylate transporter substrate binding protein [Halomonas]MBE0399632.1 tripartite tricarboxylate transporter substrate binding protein [Halomonas casei]PCC23360.1 hypothetical protein CIK78_15615 [Halomonas sp. JB37]
MKNLLSTLTLAIGMVAGGQALANDYPNKSIEVIVPFSAGGGNDTFVRALQPLLEEQLGETLVIRNIAGGGGAVGLSRGVASAADGYTMMAASTGMLSLEAMGNVPFTHEDFDFIAKVVEEPYLLAVSSESPYQTVDSLIEAASSGSVRVGVSGIGSSAHITANAIANITSSNFNLIPYPGGSEAISAVMGGHVEAVVLGGAELRSGLEAGRLNALATTYAERSDNLPDVPTFQESGYDLTISVWRGLVGPQGLPDDVKEQWVAAIQQIVEDGSYEETANNLGTELAPLYGDELDVFIDESAAIMLEAAGDLAK